MAKRTEEEKQAWKSKMKGISKKIADMTQEQQTALMDDMGCVVTIEGHSLSTRNTLMLYFQADAQEKPCTVVGGFKQWKRSGRVVMKGERSIGSIWVPIGERDSEGDLTEAPEKFILAPVFDVAQTEELEEGGR